MLDQQSGQATYGVGGGITWDSTTEGEYDEILTKASFLEEDRPVFQLLESMLLSQGEYFLFEEHLNRLKKSAKYFGFPFQMDEIQMALVDFASHHPSGEFKVRFVLTKDGELTIDAQPLSHTATPIRVMLAEKPIDKDNPFLYHKTTNRAIYSYFQLKKPADVFDVLLWNKNGEVTEFTNGNVIMEIDGQLWTPPVNSGLLAGTFREVLIRQGEIREKRLTIEDLRKSSKIWFINSVRKWIEVRLLH